jgi:uncharacterized protein (DUF305 family)
MTRRLLIPVCLGAALAFGFAGATLAQTDHGGHAADPAGEAGAVADAGYKRAMDAMHQQLQKLNYSGNPDVDFVRGMIPHHQAAVDMAKVLLVHGKDPEIRKLAQDIISTQEKEIDLMEAWLKANAPK